MSDLTSDFMVVAGLPPHDSSALRKDIAVKDGLGYTLPAGTVVAVEDDSGEVIDKATSLEVDIDQAPDHFWLVIRGDDQSDASTSGTCTCVKLHTGVAFQVDTSESFTIGDLCRADAGVIKPLSANEQKVGVIIGVNSANGTVIVVS